MTNVVVDALSQKYLHVATMMIYEKKLLEEFRNLKLKFSNENGGLAMSHMEITCDLRNLIRNG